jgi:hypothetical protein
MMKKKEKRLNCRQKLKQKVAVAEEVVVRVAEPVVKDAVHLVVVRPVDVVVAERDKQQFGVSR